MKVSIWPNVWDGTDAYNLSTLSQRPNPNETSGCHPHYSRSSRSPQTPPSHLASSVEAKPLVQPPTTKKSLTWCRISGSPNRIVLMSSSHIKFSPSFYRCFSDLPSPLSCRVAADVQVAIWRRCRSNCRRGSQAYISLRCCCCCCTRCVPHHLLLSPFLFWWLHHHCRSGGCSIPLTPSICRMPSWKAGWVRGLKSGCMCVAVTWY